MPGTRSARRCGELPHLRHSQRIPHGPGESVYHFDFYRITREAEALDIGLYDYLDSGALCLMEWPENVEGLLPEETLKVHISVAPDGARTIFWEDNG